MAETVSFYASDMSFKGDKEGEGKITFTIPATEIEKVAGFYAKNYGKRYGIALIVDESVVYPTGEEVVKTEGEGE